MVSFKHQPLYLRRNTPPLHPLDKTFGGASSRSGRGGEEKESTYLISTAKNDSVTKVNNQQLGISVIQSHIPDTYP
jgi:hypothetical protein